MKKLRFFTVSALFLLCLGTTQNALAYPIVSGISDNEINIDSSFDGQQILLFGAKRDAGDIVIAVRGPKKNFLVTKKEKLLGIWYNGERLKFKNTTSFYELFSTTYDHTNSHELKHLFSSLEIGKNELKFDISQKVSEAKSNEFYLRLVTDFENKNLYSPQTSKVDFLDETLFKVTLNFPKNISRGVYAVEIYLIDDGSLLSFQSIPIYVYQVGLGAKIVDFAYQQSFFYGLLAVAIALVFGWMVNFIFAKFFGK